jgi:hypothetical protein
VPGLSLSPRVGVSIKSIVGGLNAVRGRVYVEANMRFGTLVGQIRRISVRNAPRADVP